MGKYRVIISEVAEKELLKIKKSGDKASILKINNIFSELYETPKTGIGKPEPLKFNLTGYWSGRINKKDRLIYRIDENIVTVTFISVLGHYLNK
ncbi:Txe/YoeB family addiction module toxin [Dyadobacter sp. NIV53]|uniref:Txe/YoeB family addiction module toxin n=1 Tax=Dyadobacter sp. NIV53 TaxID=2861765 RepID=UPI001C877FAF|nr:Txe/YoeB family addiction module toxin [Dyadobacter sp. NIV53]